MIKLGTIRQHDCLLRRMTCYSLPGSKGAPPPRPVSFSGLAMRARGAQAKNHPSPSMVSSLRERFANPAHPIKYSHKATHRARRSRPQHCHRGHQTLRHEVAQARVGRLPAHFRRSGLPTPRRPRARGRRSAAKRTPAILRAVTTTLTFCVRVSGLFRCRVFCCRVCVRWEVFVWGVVLVVCVFVSLSGMLFSVGVCLCDLLIFLNLRSARPS